MNGIVPPNLQNTMNGIVPPNLQNPMNGMVPPNLQNPMNGMVPPNLQVSVRKQLNLELPDVSLDSKQLEKHKKQIDLETATTTTAEDDAILPGSHRDRPWHQKHVKFLKKLYKYCLQLRDSYHHEYIKNDRLLCRYRTPQIILSSLTGFLSVSNAGYIPPDYDKYVSLFCGVLNLCLTVVATIEGFKKVSDKTNLSKTTFTDLRQLADDITYILSIPVEFREDGGQECSREFYERFQTIMKQSVTLKEYAENVFNLNDDIYEIGLHPSQQTPKNKPSQLRRMFSI